MDFFVNGATQGAGGAPAITQKSICCTLPGSRKVLIYVRMMQIFYCARNRQSVKTVLLLKQVEFDGFRI